MANLSGFNFSFDDSGLTPVVLSHFIADGLLLLASIWLLTRLLIKLNTKRIRALLR